MGVRAEGAALGDLDGGGDRFRQIGKQRDHFGAALEAMLGIELAAVGFGQQPAFRDADQRIMRFVVGGGGEIGLVGGDQRKALAIGEIDQHRLGHALLRHAVALQFHIEAVAEQAMQRVEPRGGEMALARRDGAIERPAGSAGERDDALGLAFQPFELEPRRLVWRRVEEGARGQPHQAAIAGLARGQQHDALARGRRIGVAGAMVGVAEIDGERAADDRLDAGSRELFGEFQHTEHVVGVGERQRGLLVGFGKIGHARQAESRLPAANRSSVRASARSRERPRVIPSWHPEWGRRAPKSTAPIRAARSFPVILRARVSPRLFRSAAEGREHGIHIPSAAEYGFWVRSLRSRPGMTRGY